MLPNGCRRLSSSIRCPPSSGTRSCQPSGANTRAVPCSDTTVTASPTAAKSDLKSRHESPSRQTTSPEEPTSPGSHTPVTPSPPPRTSLVPSSLIAVRSGPRVNSRGYALLGYSTLGVLRNAKVGCALSERGHVGTKATAGARHFEPHALIPTGEPTFDVNTTTSSRMTVDRRIAVRV